MVFCQPLSFVPRCNGAAASPPLFASTQQAFNATAVVRHMRRLQLGTSLEGPSQITPTSPCHGHLLPEEEEDEDEDEDLGNGEEESCKSPISQTANANV